MYNVTMVKSVNGTPTTLYTGNFEFSWGFVTRFEASGINFITEGCTMTMIKI